MLTDREVKRARLYSVAELPKSTWPAPQVPQRLHLDLTVRDVDVLTAQRDRALSLGAEVLRDRSIDPDETRYVFADPAAHPCCIFVSPDHPADRRTRIGSGWRHRMVALVRWRG